jgi:crossover junction endodeoxyribonuclease RusA
MNKLLIELPWPPSVNHYYRRVGPRTLISREGRKYRQEICAIVRGLHLSELSGDLVMSIKAYPPDKRRRDVDNLLKSLLDSLQHAGVYHDDSQIKKLSVEMLEPCRPNGRAIVRINRK